MPSSNRKDAVSKVYTQYCNEQCRYELLLIFTLYRYTDVFTMTRSLRNHFGNDSLGGLWVSQRVCESEGERAVRVCELSEREWEC